MGKSEGRSKEERKEGVNDRRKEGKVQRTGRMKEGRRTKDRRKDGRTAGRKEKQKIEGREKGRKEKR